MKNTNNETNNKNTKKKMTFWDISKSVSLMAVALAVAGAVLGWQPFADNRENVSAYAVEDTAVVNAETNIEDIEVPYTSIYDVRISDKQLLSVWEYIPAITRQAVSKELPNATPNEFLLRCAYYDADEVEYALNVVLGITLASDWRTEEYYTPEKGTNVQEYSNNGQGYNAYMDIINEN